MLGANHSMGPGPGRMIGLGTCLAIMKCCLQDWGHQNGPAPAVQIRDAGWLGGKTGRGFYEYSI